jgi:asparagine synthase (glutamine-hydrolysing)
MCGIAGHYSKTSFFAPDDIKRMTDCMAHRGPDADGHFAQGPVALGHRRLSIIDLSVAANQPMYSHNDRYVIVFNGEIYNFQEVAKELNVPMKTHGDTEVILEAFVQFGERFVEKLNGMFAIAIYDKQTEDLYVYRDRIGIKPIYYYWDGINFAFASELKGLRNVPAILGKLSLDKQALNNYFHLEYIPEPLSIYKEVKKQPSGSYIKIVNNVFSINYYWELKDKVKPEVVTDEKQAMETLRGLVESSVRYRMISDVPFGTFLSGGTDSSVVTAVAQSISKVPVNTFSIGFKEAKFNESHFAAAVAKHLGTNHHEFIVSTDDALALVESVIDAYDEPFSDSSAIPTMLVSKLARKYVTMTLSGDGGDELFMGYGAYTWANRLNNPLVKTFRKPIGAALSMAGNKYKRAGQLFKYEDESTRKSHIFSQEQYVFAGYELKDLFTKEYYTGVNIDENTPALPRKLSVAEEQAFFDMRYYLKDDLLVKVDRATMQYSLETRVPLLDYRIIEFALNLDEQLKVKNGTQKYLLKELLYSYVPRELFNRPKWGFSIPMGDWFKKELRPLLDETLSEEKTNQIGILNYATVASLKQRFFNGEDYLYKKLWQMVVLHKWAEKYKP